MHESRMIAEVVPPGVCAMLKVSGNRMANPLAPPSPGSTPIITPSTTPVNMRPKFFSDTAIAKPCIRDWISSTSVQSEQRFDRSFGQRQLEPHLEDEEK